MRFTISAAARDQVRAMSEELRQGYPAMLADFKASVIDFVTAHEHCDGKTHSVQPLGGALKVRVALPGRGASRSLRVVALTHCAEETIETVSIEWRRDLE